MIRLPVVSSSVKSLGYEAGTLEVEFASGQVYRYTGVPADVHAALIDAKSVGKSFQQLVRSGGFEFTKVKQDEAPAVPVGESDGVTTKEQ